MSDFIPRSKGWGIQPITRLPMGGDIHESFRILPDGSLTGGHTTVRMPGGKEIHLPW